MGVALFPILLDVATTLPPPLLPGTLLRDPALLRRLRFRNVLRKTEDSSVHRGGSRRIRRLELVLLQSAHIWLSLDESEVRGGEVAQDVGFLLVSHSGAGSLYDLTNYFYIM